MASRAGPPRRAGPTHFLCIPLLRRQLAANIAAFRIAATNIYSAAPLPSSAIRPPGTMHLTLGVMALPQREQLERALSLLRELPLRDILSETREALPNRAGSLSAEAVAAKEEYQPLVLTLKGLHPMQDPAKSSVLYAPPLDADGEGCVPGALYGFCKAVRQRFIDAGLMEAESRPFVLHATVVNTVHVKGGKGRRGERMMVDARGLMEEFEEFVWLDRHEVRKIGICRMGAKPIGDEGDEAYEVVEEVEV